MIGKLLQNRYKVLDEIGAGSVSVVYLARDLDTRQIVAIKALRPALIADADSERRLRREAASLARLSDPGIVQIYDFGIEERQRYIVMEYVAGKTIAELMRERGPFPLREALAIANRVTGALAAAAAHGIVHRDIKPQNIMVAFDGQVKLMDFGIAGSISAGASTTRFLGTPHYISPEQADWKELPVDARSDIYSLGAVLFEMLSGRVLFEGDSPLRVAMKHINEPPPDIRTLRGDVPDIVANLLAKCLSKSPEDRFQRAADLGAALERILAATSSDQEPPERGRQARLVGPGGATFALNKTRITIGRRDEARGVFPDVDLQRWDDRQVIHRRQAIVELKDGRWLYRDDVGVRNRSRINRTVLDRGEEVPLTDGAQIQIGNVVLAFREASA